MVFSKRFFVIVAAIGIAATNRVASAEDFETDFSGTWRGNLQIVDPLLHSNALPDLTEQPELMEFAIEISGVTTRVYIFSDGAWWEVKPGSFRTIRHRTNAVVVATDSFFSADGLSGWVETWNFTLTAKDDDSLYAYWVRAVNNPDLTDGASQDARFFMSRFGNLRRTETALGVNAVQVSAVTPDAICRQADLACGNVRKIADNYLPTNQKIEQRN